MAGAVVMVGSGGPSPQEKLVLRAQHAATIDLIDQLHRCRIAPIIVAAPALDWLPHSSPAIREQDHPGQAFHFGSRLTELIHVHKLDTALYFGGASAPLLDDHTLSRIVSELQSTPEAPVALTNNIHSSDWLALSHTSDALDTIRAAERDNSLAWLLAKRGSHDVRTIAGTLPAAGIDLDTPADLAIIRHHPGIKPALACILHQHPLLSSSPLLRVAQSAATPETNLTLIGRVSPAAWQSLNHATQCWIRVFAEERGMVASGRLTRGEVKTLVGQMIERHGAQEFFTILSGMTDAAIIDSRPLMASAGFWPDAADRFASDLMLADQISDPWLRDFTSAAAHASIPVLLGGHSVVSGGLYALVDIIEKQRAG
ncbi:MAG: hypothetical protein JXN59_19030 [Anaerolineae bacterium]|nr:hypothetical protein [Anaerolineae bacterium]